MTHCYSLKDSRLKDMFEFDIDWIERCGASISSNYVDGIKQMCKELFGNTGYLIYLENYPLPKKQKSNGILFHPGISIIVADCSAHNCPNRDTLYCNAGVVYKDIKIFFDTKEDAMAFKLRWA